MKKIFIIFLLCLSATCLHAQYLDEVIEEFSYGVKTEDISEEISQSFIQKFFFSSEVLSKAPNEWELIREDEIRYLFNGISRTGKMSSYKLPNGKYISQIKEDDNNYVWFWTNVTKNQITGEDEPLVEWTNNILCCKRLFGDVGFIYVNSNKEKKLTYCNLDLGNEYALICPDPDWVDFSMWGGLSDESPKNERKVYYAAIKGSPLEKYKSKEEATKASQGWSILSKYGNHEKEFKLHPYENNNKTWSLRFTKEEDNHTLEVFPEKDFLALKYFITPDDFVQLSMKDAVTSIEQHGNIVDIKLEHPGDFLKYSMYAHNVFDGKLTRKNGYFNLKNDEPRMGTRVSYYITEPLQMVHYNPLNGSQKLGIITIPAGLHCRQLRVDNNLLSNYDSNREIFFNDDNAKKEIWFYDDSNNHVFTTRFSGAIFHENGIRIAREQEAALTAKIKTEEEAAVASLKQKYGAANVENVRNGTIKVGMPWNLIEKAFPYSTMDKSTYSTIYRVWNNKPQIDRANKKFIKMNMGIGQLVYVTVKNGKVTDLYFSGHK